jgi:probable 2-oxoglutarate dehydrogenase E1 component DHKTD1
VTHLQSELDESAKYVPISEWDIGQEKGTAKGKWTEMVWPTSTSAVSNPDTGVAKETLIQVGKASVEVPTGFVSDYPVATAVANSHCKDDARATEASYGS